MEKRINYHLAPMSLHEFYQLRKLYGILPLCQREKAWTKFDNQLLIDTILKLYPMHPLTIIVRVGDGVFILTHYELIDGQQRFNAIIEFMNNEYPTLSSKYKSSENPVCPNTYYKDLPPGVRNQFDNYFLPILRIETNLNDEEIGDLFRRLQRGKQLTPSEILYSHLGVAREMGETVLKHKIWTNFYIGGKKRREPFQAYMAFILFEQRGVFSGWGNNALAKIARIKHSQEISGLPEVISKKLDHVMRLYDGASISSISQLVMAYQSITLLEKKLVILDDCDMGCLTEWFMDIRLKNEEKKKAGIYNIWMNFKLVDVQMEFWDENLRTISELVQGAKRDPKRNGDEAEKLRAFRESGGTCYFCKKPLQYGTSVLHHIQPWSKGGRSNGDNFAIAHKRCNQKAGNKFISHDRDLA